MTEQEAKTIIEAEIDNLSEESILREALNKAKNSLEKQIPMEPADYIFGNTPMIMKCCPVCTRAITLSKNRGLPDAEYCSKCGQRLVLTFI